MQFEFRVIPAPNRGEKAKGLKTGADRFSAALARVMNEMGAEGWDYVRAETLPCEERKGLTGSVTVYHTMLVFRRSVGGPAVAADPPPEPHALPAPVPAPAAPVAAPEPRHAAPPVAPPRPIAADTATAPRVGAPLPSWMRRGQAEAAPPADAATADASAAEPQDERR